LARPVFAQRREPVRAELGRTAIGTRLPKWKRLAPEDLWWSSAVGFELCAQGEAGLLQSMGQLQQMMGRPEDGPKKIFGQLHECLTADPLQDDLIPFRDILRRHIEATWPLGSGDELLGEPVLTRQLHSVLTAVRLTGRTASEIRSACSKAGLLSEAAAGLPDAWAVFDAGAAAPLLEDLTQALSDDAFCKALGLSEDLFDALQSSGLLHAARRKDGLWNPIEGQALLEHLLLGAETIYVPMHGWSDIPAAARALNCSLAEIIAMIRDGRLPRLGRYVQRQGFASILVDLASVADGENIIPVGIFAVSQGIPKRRNIELPETRDDVFARRATATRWKRAARSEPQRSRGVSSRLHQLPQARHRGWPDLDRTRSRPRARSHQARGGLSKDLPSRRGFGPHLRKVIPAVTR